MPDECTTITTNQWIAGQAGTTQDDLATSTVQQQCYHPLEFQLVIVIAMAITAGCMWFGWRSLK